jgi:hypothetical protein
MAALLSLAWPRGDSAPEPPEVQRSLETPTASPPAAAATIPADVPSACARDVSGTVFVGGTLEGRLASLRVWAPGHRGELASLVLTDADVERSARDVASRSGAPVRDATAAIHPDGVRVSGVATAGPLRFPVRATLVPVVDGGALRVVTRDLDTDGLPGFLRPRVDELLREAADPAAWQLPLRVEAAVTRAGCGVIRGRA